MTAITLSDLLEIRHGKKTPDGAPVFGFQQIEDFVLQPNTDYVLLWAQFDASTPEGFTQSISVMTTDANGTFDDYESPDVKMHMIGIMPADSVIATFTPAKANNNIYRRLTMLIKFECDLDAIPGWGHQYGDWENLATQLWCQNSHYKTAYTLLGVHQH